MNRLARLVCVGLVGCACAFGSIALLTGQPAEAAPCNRGQCMKDYRECLVFCGKNQCIIDCETRLQICLDNCTK